MSRATPDQIVAHIDLLRAVDRLLADAEVVREKRDTLERLLSSPGASAAQTVPTAAGREGVRSAS